MRKTHAFKLETNIENLLIRLQISQSLTKILKVKIG